MLLLVPQLRRQLNEAPCLSSFCSTYIPTNLHTYLPPSVLRRAPCHVASRAYVQSSSPSSPPRAPSSSPQLCCYEIDGLSLSGQGIVSVGCRSLRASGSGLPRQGPQLFFAGSRSLSPPLPLSHLTHSPSLVLLRFVPLCRLPSTPARPQPSHNEVSTTSTT